MAVFFVCTERLAAISILSPFFYLSSVDKKVLTANRCIYLPTIDSHDFYSQLAEKIKKVYFRMSTSSIKWHITLIVSKKFWPECPFILLFAE